MPLLSISDLGYAVFQILTESSSFWHPRTNFSHRPSGTCINSESRPGSWELKYLGKGWVTCAERGRRLISETAIPSMSLWVVNAWHLQDWSSWQRLQLHHSPGEPTALLGNTAQVALHREWKWVVKKIRKVNKKNKKKKQKEKNMVFQCLVQITAIK